MKATISQDIAPAATVQSQRVEFEASLKAVLETLTRNARQQFEYNLSTNVEKGILKLEDCAENAVVRGIVSAVSHRNHFCIEPTIELAMAMLLDVNADAEAKLLMHSLGEH